MQFLRFLWREKGTIIFAVLIEGLFIFLWRVTDVFALSAICLIMAISIGVMVFKSLQHAWGRFDEILENERKAVEAEQKKQEMKQIWEQGEGTISAFEFYLTLHNSKIYSLDAAYAFERAKMVATDMMGRQGAPQSCQYKYLSKDKLSQLFQAGAEEYNRRIWEPQKSNPRYDARLELEFAFSLLNKTGCQKRISMFQHAIVRLKQKAQMLENAIPSVKAMEDKVDGELKALGVAMIQASQQKPASWGLAGGIAEGIAGPIAGVAVAASVMQENAEIENRNALNKAYYTDLTAKMLMSARQSHTSYDMEWERGALLEEADKLSKKIKENENKIVLEGVSAEELKQHIQLKLINVVRDEDNILNVEIRVKNTYVPPRVKMAVDGMVSADVYSGDVHVGTAHIPFPLYGITSGQTVNLVGLCPHYLEGEHKYTVKFTYRNLWVMEQ